jgi:hypothetical protein
MTNDHETYSGTAIAAAAIGTAAPASGDAGNPFSHLSVVDQCSAPAPATIRRDDLSHVQAAIQEGMQSALSPRH